MTTNSRDYSREHARKRRADPRHKAWLAAYTKSPAFKERQRAYRQSPKGIATRKAYKQTEAFRASRARTLRKTDSRKRLS